MASPSRKEKIVAENYEIGRHTYFSPDLALRTWAPGEKITIGNFCSIADRVRIFCGGLHRTDAVTTFPLDPLFLGSKGPNRSYQTTKPTVIGHDVWIGSGTTILGGVTIGHGAVIASESCVFTDVPPYAIVAGNPAAIKRFRFSKELVERLLAVAWWDWSDEKIAANADAFYGSVSEFVTSAERLQ